MEGDEPNDTSTAVADPKLCALLTKEYYLERVLTHVIPDGLHECRRVCRKWYDVCKGLPVELIVWNEKQLRRACRLFPHATSIQFSPSPERDLADIQRLTELGQLRQLLLVVGPGYETGDSGISLMAQQFVYLQAMTLSAPRYEEPLDIYSALRFLTNLTRLELKSPNVKPLKMEPLFELNKIKDLHLVHSPFINDQSQFLFPSLTHLTSFGLRFKTVYLDFNSSEAEEREFALIKDSQKRVLEIIHPYTSHLQRLWITVCYLSRTIPDWTLLKEFTSLDTLEVTSEATAALHESLKEMHRLTDLNLELYREAEHTEDIWEDVLRLTGLKSLQLKHSKYEEVDSAPNLNSLSQLTKLTISEFPFDLSSSCLTGLVDLTLHHQKESFAEAQKELAHMTNLECLDLGGDTDFTVDLKSTSLANLKKLRSLTIWRTSIDESFFATLANLADLTYLEALDCGVQEGHVPSFLTQLGLISSLRNLYFSVQGPYLQNTNPISYLFEGSLPRLRILCITCEKMTKTDQHELFMRLPCLSSFTQWD